jgi:transposase-like protein
MPSKYRRSTKPRVRPTGKKAAPTGTDADLNLASMSAMFSDEDKAREFIESKRWPDGKPACPHCGEYGAYKLVSKADSKHKTTPGTWKCKACRKKFTVRVGTIFEDSHIPLCKWLMAMHLMASSKKGVSSHQLARELDVTVKSGWFLSHRIRECMKQQPVAGMLKNVVEADECWIGGKPRPGANPSKKEYRGRGTDKTPVVVLVERDGAAVCKPMLNVTSSAIHDHLMANVDKLAALMTDENSVYHTPGPVFEGGHYTTHHKSKQYAYRHPNGMMVHSNTAESFFALLKRGHYGIFHQLSKHHLHRYCTEFSFRWRHRRVSDGHRMVAVLDNVEGKRLMYRWPIGVSKNARQD